MHCLSAVLALATVGFTTLSIANPLSHVRRSSPFAISSHSFYPRQDNGTNATAPCAQVSAYVSAHPEAVQPIVPAKLAYDCLNSIPLNVSSALALLNGLKPYVNWQSNLAWLKEPPEEYIEKVQGAVDVLARLDEIRDKVSAEEYISEYEFGFELYTVFQSTHDGHFNYIPDSVGKLFRWSRPVVLVSVSDDGQELPGIFGYKDLIDRHFNNATYTPSAVTKINDVDATEYLQEFSQTGSLQDRDALYNSVFMSLAQVFLTNMGTGSGAFAGNGRGAFVYPGPTTKLTFANGSETTYINYARLAVAFNGITSGEDVADRYFYYGSSGTAEVTATDVTTEDNSEPLQYINPYVSPKITKRQSSIPPEAYPPGFPSNPVAYVARNIAGYYLDGEGYEDVAVLFVPSFVSSGTYEEPFQLAGDQFLEQAKKDGKTKLIVDVQANGGGTILQGYDLFKKLFPSQLPYGANRFRALKEIDQIGRVFSHFAANKTRSMTLSSREKFIVSSPFNYRSDADEDYGPWQSWADKFGPHPQHGDTFMSLNRWNLSDPLLPYLSGGINITGYADRTNWTVQPFEPANIVIVTDGYCASTCTIFSEFLHKQTGVKTVALGGRANTDQMQAVGGTKGTNNFPFAYIQELVQEAVRLGAKRSDGLEPYYDYTVFSRAFGQPGLNVRDGIREGDENQVPLQFVYEPADCRLFYTPEMLIDVTEIWKAVANSQWNGENKCVGGSEYGYGHVKRDVSKTLSPRRSIMSRNGITRDRLLDAMHTRNDPNDVVFDVHGFMAP